MSKIKKKDLIMLEGKYVEAAVQLKVQVVYQDELYLLLFCGPVMAKISHNGKTYEVYSSQIFITRSTRKQIEKFLRDMRHQKNKSKNTLKREENWMRHNAPALFSAEL